MRNAMKILLIVIESLSLPAGGIYARKKGTGEGVVESELTHKAMLEI